MSIQPLLEQFYELKLKEAVNFELMNEIFISHHSTAIEGSSLTEEESRLLIVDGITAKGKPLYDHNMVKDHFGALRFIVEEARKKREITPVFIQEISAHVMLTTGSIIHSSAGDYDSSKGDWRKSSVHVGDRYFVNYQKIEREVTRLCEILNQRIKQVQTPDSIYQLAFDAHFYLVSIHPFADGNGRTSRLLMNYILSYHQLPLATIFKEDKLEYYQALEASRPQDDEDPDLCPIRDFMFAQQMKYLSMEIKKYRQAEKKGGMRFIF